MTETMPALVIGAGPAGLMAAETIAAAGYPVVVAEAMPTPARKLLMAGKTGLNLTREEPADRFAARIVSGPDPQAMASPDKMNQKKLRTIVAQHGPDCIMAWAQGLGIDLFTGSTGRVFPVEMKASPLLRAWLRRLASQGVALRTRWRWIGFDDRSLVFDTPEGQRRIRPDVCVLALGGASWPQLGSDAAWVPWLEARGVEIAPFRPANMGFRVDWSAPMTRFFGTAVKGTELTAGTHRSRGEWVIGRQGIEGGGIYQIGAALRDGAEGRVDLAPDLDSATLAARLASPRGRLSIGNWLRRVLRDPVKAALVMEWGQPLPRQPLDLARLMKGLPIRHVGPMGLDRAISSAGGIAGVSLSPNLELRAIPGVFAAGEMLDWEAPTGGYLLTACIATGRHAGLAAKERLRGD